MDDTISRSAAIKALHEVMLELFDFTDDKIEEPMTYTEVKFLHINKVIAEKIKALPSAQPEIIRCRECKWWNQLKRNKLYGECSKFADVMPMEHDFCSRAERREE